MGNNNLKYTTNTDSTYIGDDPNQFNTTTTAGKSINWGELNFQSQCPYALPCGKCRLTMMPCNDNYKWEITCNTGK